MQQLKFQSRLAALVVIGLAFLAVPAVAQTAGAARQPAPEAGQPPAEDPLGRLTPRGAVMGFIMATRRQDYASATQYLDTREPPARAQALARQLQTVLDRRLSADLDKVSRKPEGDVEDGLRLTRDQIGTIDSSAGKLDVLLDRVPRGNEPPIWLFSAETLRGIGPVFEEINAPGLEKYVPSSLVNIKILSIALWRWIEVLLGLIVSLALASLVALLLIPVIRPLIGRITHQHDDRLVRSLRAPLTLFLVAIPIHLGSRWAVSLFARLFWSRVAFTIAVAGLAWLLIRFSDVVSELGIRQLRENQRQAKIAALALARRAFKGAVIVAAVLALVQGAGMDAFAIVTGLGVGGIAVAFAAQKTLENLFAGVMIITDEPIRVGDVCQVSNQTGTVVDIGLRSTRIRTRDRSILSVPNGLLASMSLENLTSRDKTLFQHTVALRHETSAGVLRQVLAEVRDMLLAHPDIEPQTVSVRFVGFADSAVNIEVVAYVTATHPPAFLGIQEDLLLRIMDIIAASGAEMSLPLQTLRLQPVLADHAQNRNVQPA